MTDMKSFMVAPLPTAIETLAIAAIVIGVLLAAKPTPARRLAPIHQT